jgi:hypothetical protein
VTPLIGLFGILVVEQIAQIAKRLISSPPMMPSLAAAVEAARFQIDDVIGRAGDHDSMCFNIELNMGVDGRIAESPWTPLSHPVFRALWIASLVSNIGTWMQNVSAAWAMTSLSPSPLMVALVQSAASLPVFVVGLPACAVADIVDRRRLLLVTQCWMLVAAGLLAVLAFVRLMTATTLLALTFALGIGVAMNTPTWQASTRSSERRPSSR